MSAEDFLKDKIKSHHERKLSIDVFKSELYRWMEEYASQGKSNQFNEELRTKFFEECTHTKEDKGHGATIIRKIDMAPHDLFEWFKQNTMKTEEKLKQGMSKVGKENISKALSKSGGFKDLDKDIIAFGMHLTGHDRETIEQMYNDYIK